MTKPTNIPSPKLIDFSKKVLQNPESVHKDSSKKEMLLELINTGVNGLLEDERTSIIIDAHDSVAQKKEKMGVFKWLALKMQSNLEILNSGILGSLTNIHQLLEKINTAMDAIIDGNLQIIQDISVLREKLGDIPNGVEYIEATTHEKISGSIALLEKISLERENVNEKIQYLARTYENLSESDHSKKLQIKHQLEPLVNKLDEFNQVYHEHKERIDGLNIRLGKINEIRQNVEGIKELYNSNLETLEERKEKLDKLAGKIAQILELNEKTIDNTDLIRREYTQGYEEMKALAKVFNFTVGDLIKSFIKVLIEPTSGLELVV
jgi:chromosome segregation ATPase